MKLTVQPPIQPPPAYELKLSSDELVALGLLSYRHEFSRKTFFGQLPHNVRGAVIARSLTQESLSATLTLVEWS